MDKVVLFGNTDEASEVYWNFTHDSPYEVVAFTVDKEYIQETTMFELPVVPFQDVDTLYPPGEFGMFVAISFGRVNKLRAEKYQEAKEKGYELVNYVSSRATTWPGLVVGDNCIICSNAIAQPFVVIGNNVIIRGGCMMGRYSQIGDHCYLAANAVALGHVTVGPYSFLGANSTIRNYVTVAPESVIGAGALILEDTREKGVYRGNPAVRLPMSSDKLKRI